MRIKNNAELTLNFVVRGQAVDGVPPTASIAPGETKDIDTDPNSAMVVGYQRSGAISVIEYAPPVPPAPVLQPAPALQSASTPLPAPQPAFVPLSAPSPTGVVPPGFTPL